MENFHLNIKLDKLESDEIKALLKRHTAEMEANSPPGSCHYLDLDGLRAADVTVWSIWDGQNLMGCGALKQLDARHGEIKSMHVHSDARGKGIANTMLEYILAEATSRGYTRLSLETGSYDEFLPARKLYEKYGFTMCPAFGVYEPNVHSTFMTKVL